jgi:hypothetical protein
LSAAASATAVVSEPPRPSVVMSLVSWDTPWNPATIAIAPSSSAACSRPGVTSMMRALPCDEVVMTPACEPVYERASKPRLWIAMASNAIEMRSPDVNSMSSSRPAGSGLTWCASSRSSSVVSPIAETTTTTSSPALRAVTIRSATRLIRSASGDRGAAVLLHEQRHRVSPFPAPTAARTHHHGEGEAKSEA